jgi:hypothetical protein
MNKAGFLFLGAVLSIAGTSAVLAGCGSDTGTATTTTGAGGGTTGTGGSASTSTTGTGGSGGATTSSTGTGTTETLDCASYCTEVMANCKDANAQYKTMDSCMHVCAAFPVGKIDDKGGDTLGCRLYHGGANAVAAPDVHCAHAGPTGGDKDVTDTTAGTCGEGCAAFCEIAAKACTGATNEQYKTTADCMTECKTFKVDAASYSIADTGKNDFGCRMYHLSVAATDPASATMHCPHIKANSAVCTQ